MTIMKSVSPPYIQGAYDVASDPNTGNLFTFSSNNGQTGFSNQIFVESDPNGGYITTVPIPGSGVGDYGAVDSMGNIYTSYQNNGVIYVQEFDPNGNLIGAPLAFTSNINGIAIDPNNDNLYVSYQSGPGVTYKVGVFSPGPAHAPLFGSPFILPFAGSNSDPATFHGGLHGLAIDKNGIMYMADAKINATTGAFIGNLPIPSGGVSATYDDVYNPVTDQIIRSDGITHFIVYDSSGNFIGQFGGPGALPGFGTSGLRGLGVDQNGCVLACNISASSSVVERWCPCNPPGGMALVARAKALSVEEDPTQNIQASVDPIRVQPNLSRNGQPVHFLVNLDQAGPISLDIFAITGERVYQTQWQGKAGTNELVWNLTTQGGSGVASGLYIYQVKADNGGGSLTKTGKIAVLH